LAKKVFILHFILNSTIMIEDLSAFQTAIKHGIPDILPTKYSFDATVSHAPVRNLDGVLTKEERLLAISNASKNFMLF
jgi:urocanate hydratase